MATETLPFSPGIDEKTDGSVESAYLPLYKIIMWNDDVTTMEFVVRILITLLSKDYETAEKLMFEIHHQGAAHVATLPLEQAEFKVEQVHAAASLELFPFTCTIEPAS
ncbi:MAG: ATP-dependent Clp protease adaptor ClpS [Nitrospinaceae bacterium]